MKKSKTSKFSINILGLRTLYDHSVITFKYLFDIFKSMMEPGPYLGRCLHKIFPRHVPTQMLRHLFNDLDRSFAIFPFQAPIKAKKYFVLVTETLRNYLNFILNTKINKKDSIKSIQFDI